MRKLLILGAVAIFAVGCTTKPLYGRAPRQQDRDQRRRRGRSWRRRRRNRRGDCWKAGQGRGDRGGELAPLQALALAFIRIVSRQNCASALQTPAFRSPRQGDNLILNMPSDITFPVNQSDITPGIL